MTDLERLLIKIAKLLNELKIPYAVTGGIAVVFWGKPRFTQDIDIVIELTAAKIPQLIRKLQTLNENVYADQDMAKEAFERGGEFNIIDPASKFKIDFWCPGPDIYQKLKMQRARIKKICGQRVRFVSPEDLILSKLFWYKESLSTRHLEDAQSVLKIQKGKLDLIYIKKWAKQQSTIGILNNLLRK